MSTEQPAPAPANRNKLLIIIGSAVVVLLAIIAWAVSSQAIRANEEAAAKEKAIAQQSALAKAADEAQKVLDEEIAKMAADANTVCERRLVERRPTATIERGTKSTYKQSDGSFDTVGAYKEEGDTIPMQFTCSSKKGSGDSWSVFLSNDGHGSTIP
jgi:hypothetical protein